MSVADGRDGEVSGGRRRGGGACRATTEPGGGGKNWFDVFPDYKIEIVDIRDHGELILGALRAVGHGAGSDLPFEDTVWNARQVAEGEVRLVARFQHGARSPRSRRTSGVGDVAGERGGL